MAIYFPVVSGGKLPKYEIERPRNTLVITVEKFITLAKPDVRQDFQRHFFEVP